MARGKLIGNRMAAGVDEGRVYFPPRDVSPADGAPAADDFLMQLQADLGGRTVRRPRYSGDQWEHSMGNISHFRPTGEPDADYDSYQEYV